MILKEDLINYGFEIIQDYQINHFGQKIENPVYQIKTKKYKILFDSGNNELHIKLFSKELGYYNKARILCINSLEEIKKYINLFSNENL